MVKRKKRSNRWCFPASALLNQFEEGAWASSIAGRRGSTRMRVQRWREGTTNFDPYQADEFAIKLGKHPSEIWTDWFDLPEYQTPKETTGETVQDLRP